MTTRTRARARHETRHRREPAQTNSTLAAELREAAALCEGESTAREREPAYRALAYRRAADTLEQLERGVDEIDAREGPAGLDALPGIGPGIAAALHERLTTGRWGYLERLRGERDPVAALAAVPGLGPRLARQIHDALGVTTLEQLEQAAHDGRLDALPGFGPRRVAGVRAAVAGLLGGASRARRAVRNGGGTAAAAEEPDVPTLLTIDRLYRERAAEGALKRIAPRRFNPGGEAWLPVLHTRRGGWRFTALYSNTARAHEAGKTRDWVVIYFSDARGGTERQRTVLTAPRGPLAGQRVVRGREAETPRQPAARATATARTRARHRAA